LAAVEKELEEVKTNNTTLAHYINAKRKKEDAHKKAEEGQSSKGLFPPTSCFE
jgi:hypothetical protein